MRLRRKSYSRKKTRVNQVNPVNSWFLQWEWDNSIKNKFNIKKWIVFYIKKH